MALPKARDMAQPRRPSAAWFPLPGAKPAPASDGRSRLGPVAKFFRARFVRELRSAEPASIQLLVEIRASGSPIHNQKLGHAAFSCSSHTGREKFATGPD